MRPLLPFLMASSIVRPVSVAVRFGVAMLTLSPLLPGSLAWAQDNPTSPVAPPQLPSPAPVPPPVLKDDNSIPIKIRRKGPDERMSSTATRRPDHTAPDLLYRRRDNYYFQGATDLRFRSAFGSETNGTYIAATRFTVDYVRLD